jgi:8-oxo-dGTP pyrophosphatase MutT (NUDIX family)
VSAQSGNRGEPVAYTDELRDRIAANLAAHDRREVDAQALGLRSAAVAIVVTDSEVGTDHTDPYEPTDEELAVVPGGFEGLDGHMVDVSGGAAFLLARRAPRMNSHARQWALPGGKVDPGETLVEAALRETHEELGLELPDSAVLGVLDDYPTRSGYVMTPVVVWAGADAVLDPNPDEVFAAYRIGLHELCRTDSPRFVEIEESDRPVVQMALGRDLIHAPTGAVLLQFRLVCLEDRVNDRVDHLEQPVFAWK